MGNLIIGGGGTDSLAGGKVSLAGTAKARGLQTVDPRLVEIVQRAAARSPYDVQIFSGQRAGPKGGSRHNSGNALDIALIDPNTGEVIPNYKSSTGFPIYAEFAKVAREEQMAVAPEMANQFRWGGGFSDKDFDLMHFDFKPGGAMFYWTWEDGGKLTAAGAKAVPQFGSGYVYANGERYRAPPGQYASLWGREPLQSQPQDAQGAIASLMAPTGAPAIMSPDTAAFGYAPEMPQAPRRQPIDPSLTGIAAADVLAAGPRSRPVGYWDRGPGGAPDAASVPTPGINPMRPAVGGPNDRRPQPPTPPSRAQGIPDPRMRPDPASLPPRGFPEFYGEQPPPLMGDMSAMMGNAPSRSGDLSAAMGGPPVPTNLTPASRPISIDPSFGVGYRVQRDADRMAAEQDARMAQFAKDMQANRTIAAADYYQPQNIMQPPPLQGGMSARMGGPPAPPAPPDFTVASDPAPALTLNDPYANQRRPSSLEIAQQNFQMPEGWTPGGGAPPTPAMFDPPYVQAKEWFKGYSPGYTDSAFPAAPLPQSPTPVADASPQGRATWGNGLPVPSLMLEDQFNVSFAPGGPGMIADLPGAYGQRQAAPSPAPAPAAPRYVPQPHERFEAVVGRMPQFPQPYAMPQPQPQKPDTVSQTLSTLPPQAIAQIEAKRQEAAQAGLVYVDIDLDSVLSGSQPMPQPVQMASNDPSQMPMGFASGDFGYGEEPGLSIGAAPTRTAAPSMADVGVGAAGGVSLAAPEPAQVPSRPPPPTRPPGVGNPSNTGIAAAGTPFGARQGSGGILGMLGIGKNPAQFYAQASGSAPYGDDQVTQWQRGETNALGGSSGLQWTGSKGNTVTAVQNPWGSGYFTSYG